MSEMRGLRTFYAWWRHWNGYWLGLLLLSGVVATGELCVEKCQIQVDLVYRSLATYNGEPYSESLAETKCEAACKHPPAICQDVAFCQQDYACLVRCWLDGKQAGGSVLSQFDTCTRSRVHRTSTGFTLSSHFFWLPLGAGSPLNITTTAATTTSSSASAPYDIRLAQRSFRRSNGSGYLRLNSWKALTGKDGYSYRTNQTSVALSTLLGHEKDCFSYQYELAIVRVPVPSRSQAFSQATTTLHTYGLCEPEGKLRRNEVRCSNGEIKHCRTQCPKTKRRCSSGAVMDAFMSNADLSSQFDLYPEISVMDFSMQRVEICSHSKLGLLRIRTRAAWWPGFPGDRIHDRVLGYLPSCWCYSSCTVRFQARVQIGNRTLTGSVVTSDYSFLSARSFRHEDGPYRSDFLLDLPYNGTEMGFEGLPTVLSLRAYYADDVLGDSRAKWNRQNVNNTCQKTKNGTVNRPGEGHAGVRPTPHLVTFQPRLQNKSLRFFTLVRNYSTINLALSITWRLASSGEELSHCFLGYNPCWCSECAVTFTSYLHLYVKQQQVISVTKTYQTVGKNMSYSIFDPRHSTFETIEHLAVETGYVGHNNSCPEPKPVKIIVLASFNNPQDTVNMTRVFQGDWCEKLRRNSGLEITPAPTQPGTIPTNASHTDERDLEVHNPEESVSSTHLQDVGVPVVVAAACLALLCIAFVVRYRKKIRESKMLHRMALAREESFGDQPITRKSLSLLLKSPSQTSATTLLSSPTKTEKVNYNYIPMDKLHEAASKGNWTCFPSQLEFPVGQLDMERQIGTGQFGCVWLAKAYSIQEEQDWNHVAVKMLKDNSPDNDADDFLKEAQHLSKFHHANIVQLLGVVVHGTPKMVVLEYMDGGDLLAFLQRHKPHSHLWSDSDFVDIAVDIASGLRYLESKRFVHRDVAARNCLVRLSPPASPKRITVTKIADFGLARDVHGSECYTLVHKDALLPVRWLAPESVTNAVFTHATDVWSFGILMWELYTFGELPYSECGPSHSVAARISTGATLDQPANCPKRMYAMMKNCWSKNAKGRPSFTNLHSMLQSYGKAFVRRSTKSTALTFSTLGSVGEYLANDGGTNLDRLLTQSATCPPMVFEDRVSLSPSPDVTRCSCHTTSTSIFERSPRSPRRASRFSTRLSSTGQYLTNDGGANLDSTMTQSVACPPIVFEDGDSLSPSPDVVRCSCHSTSMSVFDRSPRSQRRFGKFSTHLGSELAKCRTPASLSDGTGGDGGSVFQEEQSQNSRATNTPDPDHAETAAT